MDDRLQWIAGLILLPACGIGQGSYDQRRAFEDFSSLAHLAIPAEPAATYGQFTSADPSGGNNDQGNFLRADGLEQVMVDLRGPGVLTRLWTAEPLGFLRFYFDDSPTPQIALPWEEFVTKVGDPFVSRRSRWATQNLPMTFAKSLRVTLSDQPWTYWQASYYVFPTTQAVETWYPGMQHDQDSVEVLTKAANAWASPAAVRIDGNPTTFPRQKLAPGDKMTWSAPNDSLVVDLRLAFTAADVPLPQDLFVELPDRSGGSQSVPIAQLVGVGESPHDSRSFLQGRDGRIAYFRVPFRVAQGQCIRFHNRGTKDCEFTPTITVQAATTTSPWLRLEASTQLSGGVAGSLDGDGRLIGVVLSGRSAAGSQFLEGDELIQLDEETEPSVVGTGVEDQFDSAWYFEGGEFASAVTAAPLIEDDHQRIVARRTFWPYGIPYRKSLRYRIEGCGEAECPATTESLLLIAQEFGPPQSDAKPRREAADETADWARSGLRVTAEGQAEAFPVQKEVLAPLRLLPSAHTHQLGVDDRVLSGTLTVTPLDPTLQSATISLEAPWDWTTTLTLTGLTASSQRTCIAAHLPIPVSGESVIHYEMAPPEKMRAGLAVATFRAQCVDRNGNRRTPLMTPILIDTTSRGGDVAVKWEASEASAPEGEWEIPEPGRGWRAISATRRPSVPLKVPTDFVPEPGDLLRCTMKISGLGTRKGTYIDALFDTVRPSHNLQGYHASTSKLLPADGECRALVATDDSVATVEWPVGQFASWLGQPRSIRIRPDLGTGVTVEFFGAELLRAPKLPGAGEAAHPEPLRESDDGVIQNLPGIRVLHADDLLTSTTRLGGMSHNWFNLENSVDVESLINLEAWPLGVRQIPARPDKHDFGTTPVLAYLASARGARFSITDRRLEEATRLAFRFGMAPGCGEVGVFDEKGRLVLRENLFSPTPFVPSRMITVNLLEPNSTGTLYFESLGRAPGAVGERIPLERIVVLEIR